MTNAILSIENLSYAYTAGRPSAVDQVSFSIQPRSVTAILGPNGAGKTTLLHLVLGLKSPLRGKITLADRSIKEFTRRELSRWIGLVPQSENIAFDFTVLDYVLLGRAPYLGALDQPGEADRLIAQEALREVGIAALETRSVMALSGGEQQLVTLARALTQQPSILLLDEPTSHLDLANRNATLRILDKLRRNGTTVIFTTHDPEAAALIADHLVLMRNGHVLSTGSMESTFTSDRLSETYGTPVEIIRMDGVWVVKSMERLTCDPIPEA